MAIEIAATQTCVRKVRTGL